MHHCTWPTFKIFSRDEVWLCYLTGLELLGSNDPPALASQSAGITGVSYHARPLLSLFKKHFFLCLCLSILYHILSLTKLCSQKMRLISHPESWGVSIFSPLRQGLTMSPKLECSGLITAPCSTELLGPSNPPASASHVAGTTGVPHV